MISESRFALLRAVARWSNPLPLCWRLRSAGPGVAAPPGVAVAPGVAAQPGVASIVAASSSTASVSDLELSMSSAKKLKRVSKIGSRKKSKLDDRR